MIGEAPDSVKLDPEAKQLLTSFEPENGQIVDEDRLSYLGLTLRDVVHFLESQPFLLCARGSAKVKLGWGPYPQSGSKLRQRPPRRVPVPNTVSLQSS